MESPAAAGAPSEAIRFDTLLSLIVRQRYLVLASIVSSTIVMISASFIMTPVYRARTVLAPANEAGPLGMMGSVVGQLGGVAALAGLEPGSDEKTQEAMAVLVSRQLTENFIRERGLLPILYARKWDAAAGRWKVSARRAPSLARAADMFDRRVRRAYIDKKSGMAILEIDWEDPDQAADWANEIVKRVNAQMRSRAIAEASSSIAYLTAQLAQTDQVEVRAAINGLIEAKVKQRMVATVNPEYAFRVLDPAAPPDPRDPVRPNKILFAIAGPLLGVMIGILLVLTLHAVRAANLRASLR